MELEGALEPRDCDDRLEKIGLMRFFFLTSSPKDEEDAPHVVTVFPIKESKLPFRHTHILVLWAISGTGHNATALGLALFSFSPVLLLLCGFLEWAIGGRRGRQPSHPMSEQSRSDR